MKRIFLAFVLLAGISRLAYAGIDDGAIRIAAADRPDTQGKNYALIIGNNEYDNLPTLKTAVNDATAIADVLQERYTFEQGAIKLLINATRREILKALSGFRKTLTSRDQLML